MEYWLLFGGRLAAPADNRHFRIYRCELDWCTYFVSVAYRHLDDVENDPASRSLHHFMSPPAGPHFETQVASISQLAATLSLYGMNWALGAPRNRDVVFRTLTSLTDFTRIFLAFPRLHRTIGERFMRGILNGDGGFDLRAPRSIALGFKKTYLANGKLELKSYFHFN